MFNNWLRKRPILSNIHRSIERRRSIDGKHGCPIGLRFPRILNIANNDGVVKRLLNGTGYAMPWTMPTVDRTQDQFSSLSYAYASLLSD